MTVLNTRFLTLKASASPLEPSRSESNRGAFDTGLKKLLFFPFLRNLTLKTLSLLHLVRNSVMPMDNSSQTIVMKIDDDVVMDPDQFKTFLSRDLGDEPPGPNEIGCRINMDGTVSRDVESKW